MNALTNINSRLDCYSRIYVDFSHTHTLECSSGFFGYFSQLLAFLAPFLYSGLHVGLRLNLVLRRFIQH